MNQDERMTPLGEAMVKELSEFCDALESGEPIEKRYTIRSVRLDLAPRPFGAEDVKHVRHHLKASQTILARFLGVSVQTLRSWEQGRRPVPPLAARCLGDLLDHPDVLWQPRLEEAARMAGCAEASDAD